MSELVNAKQACVILGCKNMLAFRQLKQRADFPVHVNPEVVRNRLWKKTEIVRFKEYLKTGAKDPLISSIAHDFLTGKFDTEDRKLQAVSKRTAARLNKHQSTTIHVKGVYL